MIRNLVDEHDQPTDERVIWDEDAQEWVLFVPRIVEQW